MVAAGEDEVVDWRHFVLKFKVVPDDCSHLCLRGWFGSLARGYLPWGVMVLLYLSCEH